MSNLSYLQVATLMGNSYKKHGLKADIASVATGASIVQAESGGNPTAVHTNGDGSVDRGIWQLNSKAHPDISAATAFDPQAATDAVYVLTNGFQITKFNQIWVNNTGAKSKGLDPTNIAKAKQGIVDQITGSAGGDIGGLISGDVSVGDVFSDAATGAGTIASTLTPDWLTSLGKLLGNLLNASFWKRLGVGSLGIALVVISLILVFGKDALTVVEKAAP